MSVKFIDRSQQVISEFERKKKNGLEAIGLRAVKHATVPRAKGGDMPVDTGTLRRSITHEVRGDAVYIGTNIVYATYMEYRFHYLKNAAANHGDEYKEIMKTALRS